jgi:superkiller protein 3
MALWSAASFATAERLLRQAQASRPADFWINCDLAYTLRLKKPEDNAEAIRFYQAALALRPHSPAVYNLLGAALDELARPTEAEVAFREAIRLNKDFGLAHGNLAGKLYDKGDLDGAIAESREAVRLERDYAEAHFILGRALRQKGDADGAITALREAIHLNKDHAKAHCSLGAALHDKGDLAGAIAECREAIRLKKDFAMAHNNLGHALWDAGDQDGAIAEFTEAIRLDKNLALAHNNLGVHLRAKGDVDGAIAECRQAIALDPHYAAAHNNLGTALRDKGDLAGAIAEYKKAIDLDPKYPGAHTNLGLVLYAKGDVDRAVAEYLKATRLKGDDCNAHYGLGIALHDRGDVDGAIAEYRQAIRLKDDFAEAHCSLAHILRDKGQFVEALVLERRGHELGSKKPRWPYPSAQWVKQCERLVELDDNLPAILSGKEQPANAIERAEYAQVCAIKHLYAAATRLSREAITAKPDLVASPANNVRYNAACAAALAGTGAGEDAARLTDAERAGLRNQALDWLRADLDAWRGLLDKEPDKARPAVAQQMRHWLGDRDFAGVRGPDALAKLPEAERPAWQQFWGEVQRLLDRATAIATPAPAKKP